MKLHLESNGNAWSVLGTQTAFDDFFELANRTDADLDERVDDLLDYCEESCHTCVSVDGPNILDGRLDRVSGAIFLEALRQLKGENWPAAKITIQDFEGDGEDLEYFAAIGRNDDEVRAAIEEFKSR